MGRCMILALYKIWSGSGYKEEWVKNEKLDTWKVLQYVGSVIILLEEYEGNKLVMTYNSKK